MTTPDENFGIKEDSILGIDSTTSSTPSSTPSLTLEDFSSEELDESPSPVPPDLPLPPEIDTKKKPPWSRQLIRLFFNEHPVTKEIEDMEALLYIHEDFLPSYGYLDHKPESFQSLLRIKNLILQIPLSLSASWSHYQQSEPGPSPENLSKPFEQILTSLCQTIPSFHPTSPHLQDRQKKEQKEKTHLIHLSEDEAKKESPLFQPISLTLIIEKWIHQLTSAEKAFMDGDFNNIRLEVSKTFLMADGILEIIIILLRVIHPLVLNEINFQNKEAMKTLHQGLKIETKKDGDSLLQSFKEAFPFLAFKDPEGPARDFWIDPSQIWKEWVKINSITAKTGMKKELALYEGLLRDDWEVFNEERTPDRESKDMHLIIEKHINFIKNINETFPWASIEIQNHLKTLFYLIDNPSLVSLLSGEFESDKKWRSDQIPLSTLAFKNLGELAQKITEEGVFQIEKSEDQLTSLYPEDEATLISNIRKIEDKVIKEIPTLLRKITSNSGILCQDSFLILQGVRDLLHNTDLLQHLFIENKLPTYTPSSLADNFIKGPHFSIKMQNVLFRRRLVDIKHLIEIAQINSTKSEPMSDQQIKENHLALLKQTDKEEFKHKMENMIEKITLEGNTLIMKQAADLLFNMIESPLSNSNTNEEHKLKQDSSYLALQDTLQDYLRLIPHFHQTTQIITNRALHFLLSNPMILSLIAGAHDLDQTLSKSSEIPLSSSIIKILGLKISNSLYKDLFSYGNQILSTSDVTAHADMEEAIRILDSPTQLEREKRSKHYLNIFMQKIRKTLPSQRNKTTKILWSFLDFLTLSSERQQHLWNHPQENPFVVFIQNSFQTSPLSLIKQFSILSGIHPPEEEEQKEAESESDWTDCDSMPSLESMPSLIEDHPLENHPPSSCFIPDPVLHQDYPVNPSFKEIKEDFEKYHPSVHQPDPLHYNSQGDRLQTFGSYQPEKTIFIDASRHNQKHPIPAEIHQTQYEAPSFPWLPSGDFTVGSDLHRDVARFFHVSSCLASKPDCAKLTIQNSTYQICMTKDCSKQTDVPHFESPSRISTQKEKDTVFYHDLDRILHLNGVILYPPHSSNYDEKGKRKPDYFYTPSFQLNYRNDPQNQDLMAKGYFYTLRKNYNQPTTNYSSEDSDLGRDLKIFEKMISQRNTSFYFNPPEDDLYDEKGDYQNHRQPYYPSLKTRKPLLQFTPFPCTPLLNPDTVLKPISYHEKVILRVQQPHPNQTRKSVLNGELDFPYLLRPDLLVRGQETKVEKQKAMFAQAKADLSIFGVFVQPPLYFHYNKHHQRVPSAGLYSPSICINYKCETFLLTEGAILNQEIPEHSDMMRDMQKYKETQKIVQTKGVFVVPPSSTTNEYKIEIQIHQTKIEENEKDLSIYGAYVKPPILQHYSPEGRRLVTQYTPSVCINKGGYSGNVHPEFPRYQFHSDLSHDFYQYGLKVEDLFTFGCQSVNSQIEIGSSIRFKGSIAIQGDRREVLTSPSPIPGFAREELRKEKENRRSFHHHHHSSNYFLNPRRFQNQQHPYRRRNFGYDNPRTPNHPSSSSWRQVENLTEPELMVRLGISGCTMPEENQENLPSAPQEQKNKEQKAEKTSSTQVMNFKPPVIPVIIKGHSLDFIYDTGSFQTYMTLDTFQKIYTEKERPFEVKTNKQKNEVEDKIKGIIGTFEMEIEIQNVKTTRHIQVRRNIKENILGLDVLSTTQEFNEIRQQEFNEIRKIEQDQTRQEQDQTTTNTRRSRKKKNRKKKQSVVTWTRPVFSGKPDESPSPDLSMGEEVEKKEVEKKEILRRTDKQRDSFEVTQARNNIYLYGVSISPPIPSLYTPEGWRPFSHRYVPRIHINEKEQEEDEGELDIIDPRNENLNHLQEDTLLYQKFKKDMKNLICFIDPPGSDFYTEKGQRKQSYFFPSSYIRTRTVLGLTEQEKQTAFSSSPAQTDFNKDNVCRLKELLKLSNKKKPITIVPPNRRHYEPDGSRVSMYGDYETIPVVRNSVFEYSLDEYIATHESQELFPHGSQAKIDFQLYINTLQKIKNFFITIQLPNPAFYEKGKRKNQHGLYYPRVIVHQDPTFNGVERQSQNSTTTKYILFKEENLKHLTDFKQDIETFKKMNELLQKHHLLVVPPHEDFYHNGTRLMALYGPYRVSYFIDFTSLQNTEFKGGNGFLIQPLSQYGPHSDINNDIHLYQQHMEDSNKPLLLTISPPNLDHYDDQGERLTQHGFYLGRGLQITAGSTQQISPLLFRGQRNTILLEQIDLSEPCVAVKLTPQCVWNALKTKLSFQNHIQKIQNISFEPKELLLLSLWFLTFLTLVLGFLWK